MLLVLSMLAWVKGENRMTESIDNFYRHIGVYGICVVDGSILVIRKI